MTTTNDWITHLREFLCKIYKKWGLDCSQLGPTPTEWIDSLLAQYEQQGAPTFPDQPAREAYLVLLDDTDAHLDKPQNSLSQADDVRLRNLITNLRHDVGNQDAG